MKQVIIVSYYLNIRDTDRCYTVYNYFKEKGYEVKVLCGDYDHNSKSKTEFDLEGVETIPVLPYKKNMSATRMISAYKFGLDAKKKLKTMEGDILYVVGPPNSTAYLLAKTARKKGMKFISDIYDLYPETIPFSPAVKKVAQICGFWWWSHLRNAAMRKADVFIGSCKYYFSLLRLKECEKSRVVPLCKGNSSVFRNEKLDTETIHILYLGALTGNYDFEGLVSIIEKLKQKKKVQLHIIGEGPRKDWLLSELGRIGADYEFLGRVYDDGIKAEVMKKCHFGFNGFKENVAIALSYKSMEYMSNALALINRCKEDTWELVEQEKIGLNYNDETVDELVEKIAALDADEIFRMQNNAATQYKQNYTYQCFVEKMDEIFE
ncbi:MAG: glycosyltransferase [Eubacterium sp.]|nr:glycosyltransferase [Eubacterium sp.]